MLPRDREVEMVVGPAGETPAVEVPNLPNLSEALTVLRGRTIAVLTGAGVSTDSGIPDYRGAGAPARTPMTLQQFLADESNRARYWAGSHQGWRRFTAVSPNVGHRALARLEQAGIVSGLVTQNVDELHRRAGSRRVVELHGTVSQVRCLRCGQHIARSSVAERLARANPALDDPEAMELAPDGDAIVTDVSGFSIPPCLECGGLLKPDVVFFGETVPRARFRLAASIVQRADALLIAGSSLAVNSGVRLLEVAARAGKPVVIVNRGATKGDAKATVRLEGGTSEVLDALAAGLIDRQGKAGT